MSIKRIDHIAIVVPDVEKARGFYEDALGMQITHVEQVDEQEVIVAFLPAGDSEIELVEPLTEDSGVAKYMKKRGAGIHHIALEVEDIEGMLATLKEKDVRLINQEPTRGSGGKRVAFIHPESTFGVLVELYESTPEESALRDDTIRDLQNRFSMQRQAVSAGFSAFVRALRSGDEAGNGGNGGRRGIQIKAEGETLDAEDG